MCLAQEHLSDAGEALTVRHCLESSTLPVINKMVNSTL